jgi:hypothetical protein
MLNDLRDYQMKEAAVAQMAKPMTLRDILGHRKVSLETQLADVNDAINALDSNPEFLKVLESVQKVNRLL